MRNSPNSQPHTFGRRRTPPKQPLNLDMPKKDRQPLKIKSEEYLTWKEWGEGTCTLAENRQLRVTTSSDYNLWAPLTFSLQAQWAQSFQIILAPNVTGTPWGPLNSSFPRKSNPHPYLSHSLLQSSPQRRYTGTYQVLCWCTSLHSSMAGECHSSSGLCEKEITFYKMDCSRFDLKIVHGHVQ